MGLGFLDDPTSALGILEEPSTSVVPTGGAAGGGGQGMMLAGPVVAGAGSLIARGLARFPILRGAIMEWAARGVRLTPEKLWAMARKFGPQFLITAGILSLPALTELLVYRGSTRRRRMNSLNPRALSRATRRLCSFERRSAKVHRVLSQLSKKKYGRAC